MGSEPDVVVVGGGMVGASLGAALATAGLDVVIVESSSPAVGAETSYDDRVIALSFASRRILEGIAVWESLRDSVTPIERIHVSDRGHFGFTRLNAGEMGIEAFGYVTDARAIRAALGASLAAAPRVRILSPASVHGVELRGRRVQLDVEREGVRECLAASLVVAADGGSSEMRRRFGIGAEQRDYGHSAIAANVTPARNHDNTAYERFTDTGPLALLPMTHGRCGLVWSVPREDAEALVSMDETAFLERLGARFGTRLGPFLRVGARAHYPLRLIRSRERIAPRLAIVGNAARTLHPVAGQGLNLGLRDTAVLAEVLADARRAGQDPGERTVLARYAGLRQVDQRHVTWFTDGLVRLFSNRVAPLVIARNLGLLAMDLSPGLKREFARGAMGLTGRQSRLARGLQP